MRKITLLGTALLLWLSQAASAQAQWTKIQEVPTTDVYALTAAGNTVYAATGQHVYTGTNGTNWAASGQVHQQPHAIEAIAHFNGSLYAATYGSGLFRSTNGGQTWEPANQGLGYQHLTDFAQWGNDLYLSTDGGGIYKLGATGNQWQAVNNGLYISSFNTLVAAGNMLIAGPGINGHIYTLDQGQAAWNSSPITTPINWNIGVNSFAVSGDTIFAGTTFRVITSTDNGQTWTFDREGMEPGSWTRVAVYNNLVLAAISKPNGSSRVYYRNLSQPIGTGWQVLTDLPTSLIYKMEVLNGKLYAGRNDGLYVLDLSPVLGSENPAENTVAHLGMPFPNPAENEVTVPFTLPQNTRQAQLNIVELATGRMVKQVQLSTIAQQENCVITGLPNGLFTCQLVADGKVLGVQKLVVLQ